MPKRFFFLIMASNLLTSNLKTDDALGMYHRDPEREHESYLYRTYGANSKEVEAYHQQKYKQERENDAYHPLAGMNSTSINPNSSWTREKLEACATCLPEYRTFPIDDQEKAKKILAEKYGPDWRFNKPTKHYSSMDEYDADHPGWREKNEEEIKKTSTWLSVYKESQELDRENEKYRSEHYGCNLPNYWERWNDCQRRMKEAHK